MSDVRYLIVLALLVSVAAGACLVAIGAARSRRHWFFGALAMWGVVMLLAGIRAYDPAIASLIVLPVVALVVRAMDWCASPPLAAPGRGTFVPRFSLQALLLSITVSALWLGTFLVLRRAAIDHATELATDGAMLAALRYGGMGLHEPWPCLLVPGVYVGLVAALAFRMVVGPWRRACWIWVTAAIAIPALILPPILGTLGRDRLAHALLLVFVAGSPAATVLLLAGLIQWGWGNVAGRRSIRQRIGQGGAVLTISAIGVPLAVLYGQMLWLSPMPPPPATPTNNYNEILAVARELNSLREEGDEQVLLQQALSLLDAPNVLQLEPSRRAADETRQALALLSDRMAETARNSPPEEAARHAVGSIRLGTMLQRGGTTGQAFAGFHTLHEGYDTLARIRKDISSERQRDALRALQQAIDDREDFAAIRARDRAWRQRTQHWRDRLADVLEPLEQAPSAFDETGSYSHFDSWNQLVQADLAIRMFHHDNGHWPADLNQLVPDYLAAVPIDPYDGTPLRYRIEGEQFVLYSVGRDCTDNGGRFDNYRRYFEAGELDFDLDTLIRP